LWFEASQVNNSRDQIAKIPNTKKGLEVWLKCACLASTKPLRSNYRMDKKKKKKKGKAM
jgi:hypothetical protein